VANDADSPRKNGKTRYPSVRDLVKFTFFSGLLLLSAWMAGTGRVAYTLAMLVIAAALAYAVLDLVDYEITKRKR
jgi:hypothetical protein